MSLNQLSDKDYLSRKDIENNVEIMQIPSTQRRNLSRKLFHYLGILVISGLSFLIILNNFSNGSILANNFLSMFEVSQPSLPVYGFFEVQPPLTAIEVTNNQLIFNDTLSDELTGNYEVPEDFNFTGGYLTLNFTNKDSASTAPLVIEITFDEYPIWRSSIPIGKENAITTSSTNKNITEYLSIFKTNKLVKVNLLEGYSSTVDVSLELTLTSDDSLIIDEPISVENIFIPKGPASKIIPLTNNGKSFNLPNSDKFSINLPQLTSNSTVAKLSFFASLSNDEIAYFKKDDTPLRYLNVFINDIYVNSVNPKPILYHPESVSEVAYKNFDPLVDYGNFVGLVYEIDLISVLPLLWKNEVVLDVVVVSPVIDFTPGLPVVPKPITKYGGEISTENWFVSGNLLVWESSNISDSDGYLLDSQAIEISTGVLTNPPSFNPWSPQTKNQFAKDLISSNISSLFKFTLIDNSTLSYTINSTSTTNSILTKQLKTIKTKVGPPTSGTFLTSESLSLVLINNNYFSYIVVDNKTKLNILQNDKNVSYPLTIDETTKKSPYEADSIEIRCDVNTSLSEVINGATKNSLRIEEYLSNDIVGLLTNIRYKNNDFSREVEVLNGIITKDSELDNIFV